MRNEEGQPEPRDATDAAADRFALENWIDEIADRFEAAWKLAPCPPIAQYLADCRGDARRRLEQELLRIDAAYRARANRAAASGESGDSQPPDAEPSGEPPSRSSPALMVRCPHCLESVEQSGRESFRRILCPHCGRHFGLLNEAGRADVPQVAEHLKLLEPVGRGHFGTVWKARDVRLDRLVAVKIPRLESSDVLASAQALKEARSLARLVHPGIVGIHEVGSHGGSLYLVSEYVEGETLQAIMARRPPSLRRCVEICRQVALALAHAHACGVVHRDLKPANVMIDEHGEPRIVDFGLARRVHADVTMTHDGKIVGTPAYMSPEQARGDDHATDHRSDVYSLGVVLYELLTGAVPFRGSVAMLLSQILHDDPPAPRRLSAAVPRDLENVTLKCLEKEPARRYQTAAELADDLGRWLEGMSVRARPVGRLARAWRWARRNPLAAVLAAAFVIALVGAAAAGLYSAVLARRAAIEANARAFTATAARLESQAAAPRVAGWSREAWDLAVAVQTLKVPADLRNDHVWRGVVTGILVGLDAEVVVSEEAAACAAWDLSGTRLVLAGLDAFAQGSLPTWSARRIDDNLAIGRFHGAGSVCFNDDGRPLLLRIAREGKERVQLVTTNQELVWEWQMPRAAGAGDLVVRLSPLARLAGATRRDGPTCVWDTARGERLLQSAIGGTTLCFDDNGTMVAIGDSAGKVRLLAIPEGELLLELGEGALAVESLAFELSARRRGPAPDGELEGRLAVGTSGGAVHVWDLAGRRSFQTLRGGIFECKALAFSPDGTLLATGGRNDVRLWDVDTGELVLQLPSGDAITTAAFSPDGSRLAVTSQPVFGPGSTAVWRLHRGRGTTTLYGLSAPIARMAVSADARYVAALAHDWRIGVWEVHSGRLVWRVDAPAGQWQDNAALALAPSGNELFFSAQETAVLWNVGDGREVARWRLPPGLGDVFCFHSSARRLLFRVETQSGQRGPWSGASGAAFSEDPRVCRMRELFDAGAMAEIYSISELNEYVYPSCLVEDAGLLFVDGIHQTDVRRGRLLAVDLLTGETVWSKDAEATRGWLPAAASDGGVLTVEDHYHPGRRLLIDAANGEPLGTRSARISVHSLGAAAGAGTVTSDGQWLGIFEDDSEIPTFILDRVDPHTGATMCFDRSGEMLAVGRGDGRIVLYFLNDIRERLNDVLLGW